MGRATKMAAIVGRSARQVLLKAQNGTFNQQANFSAKEAFKGLSKGKKIAAGVVGTATAGAVGLGVALRTAVMAGDLELHPPAFPWSHKGPLDSLDHQVSVVDILCTNRCVLPATPWTTCTTETWWMFASLRRKLKKRQKKSWSKMALMMKEICLIDLENFRTSSPVPTSTMRLPRLLTMVPCPQILLSLSMPDMVVRITYFRC